MSTKKYFPNLIGNHEKRMCGTKKRYTVEESAREMIKQMQKWGVKVKLEAYQCSYCHYWHVGRVKVRRF